MSALDGCSSVLESARLGNDEARRWAHLLTSPDADMGGVIGRCQQSAYTARVPTLSLAALLDLVFGQPGGQPRFYPDLTGAGRENRAGSVSVEYVKIDAQGFDLEVKWG